MTQALKELGKRDTVSGLSAKPKIMTLGGDHSLTLPALRSLNEIYGRPIRVLHFDGEINPCFPGIVEVVETAVLLSISRNES